MASVDAIISQALTGLLYMMLAAIVGLMLFIMLVIRKHKLRMNLKEVIKGNFIVHTMKAKFMRDSEGVEWWKTLKRINGKKYFPVPGAQCIYVDKKGNKCVDGYVSPAGEVVYIEDPNRDVVFQSPEFLKRVQPVTTNQRQIWINQERKAQEDRGFTWKQHLLTIAGALVLIIVVVLGIFGYQDIQSTSNDITKVNLEITNKQLEIAEKYSAIYTDIQYIKEEVGTALSPAETPIV